MCSAREPIRVLGRVAAGVPQRLSALQLGSRRLLPRCGLRVIWLGFCIILIGSHLRWTREGEAVHSRTQDHCARCPRILDV